MTPPDTLRGIYSFDSGLNLEISLLFRRDREFQRTTQGRYSTLVLCRSLSLHVELKELRINSGTFSFPVWILLPFLVTYPMLCRSTSRKDPGNSESRNTACNILGLLQFLFLYFKAAFDQNTQGVCECNGLIPQDHGNGLTPQHHGKNNNNNNKAYAKLLHYLARMYFDLYLKWATWCNFRVALSLTDGPFQLIFFCDSNKIVSFIFQDISLSHCMVLTLNPVAQSLSQLPFSFNKWPTGLLSTCYIWHYAITNTIFHKISLIKEKSANHWEVWSFQYFISLLVSGTLLFTDKSKPKDTSCDNSLNLFWWSPVLKLL